jgi:hypothetical protein
MVGILFTFCLRFILVFSPTFLLQLDVTFREELTWEVSLFSFDSVISTENKYATAISCMRVARQQAVSTGYYESKIKLSHNTPWRCRGRGGIAPIYSRPLH